MTAKTLWNRLGKSALGRWLFIKILCIKAPYFSSVSPRITKLELNICEGYFHHKRKVQNHLGTVNAIALCNLAELCAGLVVDVSLPANMRWIPQGMTVQYLKKANGTMRAFAEPVDPLLSNTQSYAAKSRVIIKDKQDDIVFTAEINMWISPRK